MRIVIDLQGAQTESRFRGIGRYSLSFAQAVCRLGQGHEVFIALNGMLPDSIEAIRTAFHGLLPQENIKVWQAPGPVREHQEHNANRREVAEHIREAFLASLQPDVVHISSLFEGYGDDAVTSIHGFDQVTPVTVAFYDLIPLLNPEQYLTPNPAFRRLYLRKLDQLQHAACCLAISEFAGREALQHLGQLSPGQVCNVSSGLDPQFRRICIGSDAESTLRAKWGLDRAFVMYAGGSDERKNLPRLIQAYAGLPATLRQSHQLLLAGRMPGDSVAQLKRQAMAAGLAVDELRFTGYISDEELAQLYNLCALFVFPSWHEGFGLPALEAMACGAPVIGAHSSSLPEVIGFDQALFDPFDTASIIAKMAKALSDIDFQEQLRAHARTQSQRFTWDESARRAFKVWAQLTQTTVPGRPPSPAQPARKPRLALVTPLPPERTGIADYSAELLPVLAQHYELELILHQDSVDTASVQAHGQIRDVDWLRANAHTLDRVLYQMGNSQYHSHMLPLLEEVPGTVVLHDFYLSGLLAWQEAIAPADRSWVEALHTAHGYIAVQDRFVDAEAAKARYPANYHVLQRAQGVIVHSGFARTLADQWYGSTYSKDWVVLPLLRAPVCTVHKAAARQSLGLHANDFLVCSFGFLDPSKCNHRLLQAWLNSALAQNPHCKLVFVGENHGGNYGAQLLQTIAASGLSSRITVTGFATPEQFRAYLAAADMAVQLRSQTRGETSAAVLDCMNHGLPTVVNAHGSMAELPADAVWMLPDEFTDAALIQALETWWADHPKRQHVGDQARSVIQNRHSPQACAQGYADAIEHFHRKSKHGTHALVQALVQKLDPGTSENQLCQLAACVAASMPPLIANRQLLLDITATRCNGLKTGIERVAHALLMSWLKQPPAGFRVEPVYLTDEGGHWHHRYARHHTLGLLGCPTDSLNDDCVDPRCGDLLLCLDLSGEQLVQAHAAGLIASYRNGGVRVYHTVFDLLPLQMPDVFPPEADAAHARWLHAVAAGDGAVCISQAVATDLTAWLDAAGLHKQRRRPFHIGWAHLGADLSNAAPTSGMPGYATSLLQKMAQSPTFLMVGTIEPRKAHAQVLQAFTHLWQQGVPVHLVIVGREGWQGVPSDSRRDIPATIQQLTTHPQHNQNLFWVNEASDEFLQAIYASSTCLLAASYGEGFGLPLIEAAQHSLPILARDLPVFREVAGPHASYFQAATPVELATAIQAWLQAFEHGTHPRSSHMPWLTWAESASQFAAACP